MKTIDQQLEADRKTLAKLTEDMARLKEINDATSMSSWGAVDTWLAKEVNARYLELASPQTADARTHALRGEIAAMSVLRALPKQVMDELQRCSAQAKVLQDKFHKWHNRGRSELRPAVVAATNLADRSNT